MAKTQTRFGSLEHFEKGGIQPMNDDPPTMPSLQYLRDSLHGGTMGEGRGRPQPQVCPRNHVRAGLYHPFDSDESIEFLGKSAFGIPMMEGSILQ